MPTKRDVLQVFAKSKLIEISSNLGYKGLSVLTKDEIVSKLSRLRASSVEDILSLFKINELRFICTKLSLNPGGLSKQTLIDRIVGKDIVATPRKPKKAAPTRMVQPNEESSKVPPNPKSPPELIQATKLNKGHYPMNHSNHIEPEKHSWTKGNNFQAKANFIWQVADDILRGTFKQHEYGDVTLPFVVLRRLDCVFEDRKDAVIETYKQFKDKLQDPSPVLYKATGGLNFYNTSYYDLRRLAQDAGNIEMNFWNYVNGYSKNVRDIIDNFQIEKLVSRLAKNDLLFMMVDKFTEIDFHPDVVANHEMGYIFEELLRRFSEMSNETAGEHYTPREVIRLMVNLLFAEHQDELKGTGIIRTVFDPACGTGGMLTIAKDHILNDINPNVEIVMYGQESNEQTYAIAKSDVLIMGANADNIRLGSSFSRDGFQGNKFNFMLSNPPFGVSWKKEQGFINNEANDPNGRFLCRISRG